MKKAKKKNKKQKQDNMEMKILPRQAYEQSDSDELLPIVHKMPCTRHLSRKERTKLVSII